MFANSYKTWRYSCTCPPFYFDKFLKALHETFYRWACLFAFYIRDCQLSTQKPKNNFLQKFSYGEVETHQMKPINITRQFNWIAFHVNRVILLLYVLIFLFVIITFFFFYCSLPLHDRSKLKCIKRAALNNKSGGCESITFCCMCRA